MICTRCNYKIKPKQKYYRTKRGAHHVRCCSQEAVKAAQELLVTCAYESNALTVARELLRLTKARRLLGDALYASFGYALATRVMQSDLYKHLDERERAECDAMVNGEAPISDAVPDAPLGYRHELVPITASTPAPTGQRAVAEHVPTSHGSAAVSGVAPHNKDEGEECPLCGNTAPHIHTFP